jgi:hypothetical protein
MAPLPLALGMGNGGQLRAKERERGGGAEAADRRGARSSSSWWVAITAIRAAGVSLAFIRKILYEI